MIAETTRTTTTRRSAPTPSLSELARARLMGEEGGAYLRCRWDRVLMAHYRVKPEALRPYVPFALDLHEGWAYVTLVSFTLADMRFAEGAGALKWIGSPFCDHAFLNVRTYVRIGTDRGIYFLAEWLNHRVAAAAGPVAYGLPYRHGRIAYEHRHEEGSLRGKVRGTREWQEEGWFELEVPCSTESALAPNMTGPAFVYTGRPDGRAFETCDAGSLDEFLMERYVAFTQRRGVTRRFRVWHEPWRKVDVTLRVERDDLIRSTGKWFEQAEPVGAHYSPGTGETWMGRPRRTADGRQMPPSSSRRHALLLNAHPADWALLLLMPLCAAISKSYLPAWAFMWAMATAIYAGCKWLTWRQAVRPMALALWWRSVAYLVAWPGMDAARFLSTAFTPAGTKPAVNRARITRHEWPVALAKSATGAALIWVAAPALAGSSELAAGWAGMIGLVLLLHFGLFHLLSLVWRSCGVDAPPLMNRPLAARSLSEFWSKRWNAGFRDLAHQYLLTAARVYGLPHAVAVGLVYLVSGLVHELVISLPAGAGFGLPTLYFLLQGTGVFVERSNAGKRMGLRRGLRGWIFTAVVAGAPAHWLFHPPFVINVIVPFLRAIGGV